jgi:hypothetical protein
LDRRKDRGKTVYLLPPSGSGDIKTNKKQNFSKYNILLTSDRPVLVYQRQLMDLATTHVNSNCTFKDCGEAISMSNEIIASAIYIKWVSMLYLLKFCFLFVFISPLPEGGREVYCFTSVLPHQISAINSC